LTSSAASPLVTDEATLMRYLQRPARIAAELDFGTKTRAARSR
jgi:hypothetical protein